MIFPSKIADFFARMAIGILIGMLFGFVLSEVSFYFTTNKESSDRDPRRVELVIPYGTAEQVKQGLYNRSLPSDLELVQGDVLVVKNEDTVTHQLGPLVVPPNSSSVLSLDTASNIMYECSFQPTSKMGLNIRARADSSTKLQAMLAVGLPTGMMLAVYSYMFSFGKKKTDQKPQAA